MFLVVGLWGLLRWGLIAGLAAALVMNVRNVFHGQAGFAELAVYDAAFLFVLVVGPRRLLALVRRALGRRGAGAAIILCGLVATSARAEQPPPLHDIPWYSQHRAERDATLAWCHVDTSRLRMWDCHNAEAASNERVLSRQQPRDFLTDPNYWRANPMLRDGVLRICAHPSDADGPYLRYCRYAAMGF